MEINRLRKDELLYELYIRKLPTGNTVADLRLKYREALRIEKDSGESLVKTDVVLDFDREMDICEKKIFEMDQALENFDDENAENEFKSISTKLRHVSARISRITGNNDLEEQKRIMLVQHCQQLENELAVVHGQSSLIDNLANRSQHISLLDTPLPTNQSPVPRSLNIVGDLVDLPEDNPTTAARQPSLSTLTSANSGFGNDPKHVNFLPTVTEHHYNPANASSRRATLNSASGFLDTPEFISSPVEDYLPYSRQPPSTFWNNDHRMPDIARWNVKFNGRTSVNEFLERIEELRMSRGVSHQQLLRCAPELLTQDALLWYRTRRFSSWQDLVSQLREAYLPYDYEFSLMDEIRRRTQGAQEKVMTFINVMENLLRKLKQPPSEIDRVALIKRNLLPNIQSQLALHQVSTVDELIRLGRAVEETEMRIQRFVPPPSANRSLLEPELAYRKPSGQPSVAALKSPSASLDRANKVPSPDVAPPVGSSSNVLSSPSCWNCGKTGHRFKKCTQPRKRFCFKCGENNCSVYNCPNCRKNWNRSQQ